MRKPVMTIRWWCSLFLALLASLAICRADERSSSVLHFDRYGSLQACCDALPETGGTIQLPAHTTIVLTNSLVCTKPNVTLRGEGWGTVILRGKQAGATLLEFGGISNTVADLTIDGNGLSNTTAKVELRMKGDCATVRHVQVRNARKMGVGLKSNGGVVTNCLITGLGPVGLSSYGIWAIANTSVSVVGNTIRDTFIDGIGVDGTGSRIIDNTLTNCHHDSSTGGGQIAVYPHSRGVLVQGNTIYRGGNQLSGGIELNGNETMVISNTILHQARYGIQMHSPHKSGDKVYGFTIVGNRLQDCGHPGKMKNQAISLSAHISQVLITDNTFSVGGPDKEKLVGINIAGNNDQICITNNHFVGYSKPIALGPKVGPALVITNSATP